MYSIDKTPHKPKTYALYSRQWIFLKVLIKHCLFGSDAFGGIHQQKLEQLERKPTGLNLRSLQISSR